MHVVQLETRMRPTAQPACASSPLDMVRNENELSDRLADAVPGDIIPYHIGMLAADRSANSLVLTDEQRTELNALAARMFQLTESGRVHLLQRRAGPERFVYLAVVRPRPPRLDHAQTIRPAFGNPKTGTGHQRPRRIAA